MYWSPNFLAVVFKKQEISQQVVTRMQDLASEFSKIFRGWYPWTLTAGGGTFSSTRQPARPLAGCGAHVPRCWDPNLGPLHFSAVVTPLNVETIAAEIQVESKTDDTFGLLPAVDHPEVDRKWIFLNSPVFEISYEDIYYISRQLGNVRLSYWWLSIFSPVFMRQIPTGVLKGSWTELN